MGFLQVKCGPGGMNSFWLVIMEKRKLVFICGAILLLGLFVGVAGYGYISVLQRADMVLISSYRKAAQEVELKGQKELAARYYRTALSYYQQHSSTTGFYQEFWSGYLQAGDLYFRQRRFRTARKYYKLALEYNPLSFVALASLGRCDFELGDYQAARSNLEKSRRLHPLRPSTRKVLWTLKRSGSGKETK